MADAGMYVPTCYGVFLISLLKVAWWIVEKPICIAYAVWMCFCAVGEALVSIETSMQNKVIELLFVTQASRILRKHVMKWLF